MNKELKAASKKLTATYAAWIMAKTEYNNIVYGQQSSASAITFSWKKITKRRARA